MRLKMYRLRESVLDSLRHIIFMLFRMNKTSLEERSVFWVSTSSNCFLAVSIHRQQVFALWRSLKLYPVEVEKLRDTLVNLKQNADQLLLYVQERARAADVTENVQLIQERARLYAALKANPADNNHLFSSFDIAEGKKRKQNLTAHLLWNNIGTAKISARAVLEILGVDTSALHMCSSEVGRSLLLIILGEVARSFMKSVVENRLHLVNSEILHFPSSIVG